MANVTIIIPTLNEEENVNILLERIFKVRDLSDVDFDVLFVDSASSDGTCNSIMKWQEERPVKLLCCGVNVDLAPAVIAGCREIDSDYVLVMDADLSHPPEKIPNLLKPLLAGKYDMMIGSRYVEGGGMPDWPFSRKLSSRLATLPALFFSSVKDPLAGFFALKRRLIAELPTEVSGFKIGLAVLAEYQRKIRIKEIPIEFRDRKYGLSKMNNRVIFTYLCQLRELVKYRLGILN